MRTIRPSRPGAIVALGLLSIVLAACAGSSASSAGPAQGRDNGSTAGGVYPGGEAAASAAPAAPGGVEGTPGDGVGAPVDDAKIVRTGTIDLEVKDVTVALRTARDAIIAMGGYVGASNTSNQGDQPVATITYRIPVSRWEDALDVLRALNGQTTKVVAEQTQAVEVTGAVVDLQARIQNLRASEIALQDIASKTAKVSDLLEVQAQLTAVRGEIESLSAQLKDLTDRADFATLTASFQVPVVAVEVATKDWDPSTVVDEASASLVDVLQALTTAGIWFVIVWLPIILVLGILAFAVAWALRRVGLLGSRRHPDGPASAGGTAAAAG